MKVKNNGQIEFAFTDFTDSSIKFCIEALPNRTMVLIVKEYDNRINIHGSIGWALTFDIATSRYDSLTMK